jgi:hypothetical protein
LSYFLKQPHVSDQQPKFSVINMNTISMDAADRISQLPEHIKHHMLSLLSTPEVVRLSVLSKTWHQVFNSFPISEFSSSSFLVENSDRSLEFATFVYNSLLRQCRQYRSIPKFQFSVTDRYFRTCFFTFQQPLQPQLAKHINRCIQLGTQKGVKELSIYFCVPDYYRLPEATLSVKELVVCRLAGCILSGPINWPSLRELSLKQVKICDQRIFDNLVFTCPFIEKFALVECDGLKYLHLSGLRKLKKVKVKRQSFPLMEKIEIDVVSLHTFSYSPFYFEKTHIDLTSCKNLEVFKFKGCTESFRKYLKNLNQIKRVILCIFCYSSSGFEKIVSKVSDPVLHITHLKLKTYIIEKKVHSLVDVLFCICRPESLFLVSGRGTNDEFMKILCKKLVRRVKHKHYCGGNHLSGWQHDLKGVQIERCGRNGYRKVVTCDAFLDSLQTLEPKETIRFEFEWSFNSLP